MTWTEENPFEEIGMTKEKMILMNELAECSDYWMKAKRFVQVITNRKLHTLSTNQRRKLNEIIFSLADKMEEKAWGITEKH